MMERCRKQTGFTLIELMVVVAIVGILAAVVYPTYLESVNKSRRADAKAIMATMAQQLERCFTQENSYKDCSVTNSSEKHHKITVTEQKVDAYTLTAVPQYTDSRCGTLSIDNTGALTSKDNDYCW